MARELGGARRTDRACRVRQHRADAPRRSALRGPARGADGLDEPPRLGRSAAGRAHASSALPGHADRRLRGSGARRSTASSSTRRSCTPPRGQRGARRTSSTTWRTRPRRGHAAAVIEEQVERIREQVGGERVICALSGGVDSAVAALLVHQAVGDQLHVRASSTTACCRQGRGAGRSSRRSAGHFHVPLVHVDAEERFLARLEGVTESEEKRRPSARSSSASSRARGAAAGRRMRLPRPGNAVLRRDRVGAGARQRAAPAQRSSRITGTSSGLPRRTMEFELVEPLRQLFKDEVRRSGRSSACRSGLVWRQPFPGRASPSASCGEVTEERLEILREADAILQDEIRTAGLYRELWQSFAVLPADSVGRRPRRRAHIRVPDRHPRRHVRGRDDRRLGATPS